MAGKRVTMQDIADACGLSRNTVSKIFNHRGAVPQATRELILQKAQELGYGLPVQETPRPAAPAPVPVGRSIALLTSNLPTDYHFATFFLPAFSDQVCRSGYNLRVYEISRAELQARQLPPHMILEETVGIIGIELFDEAYLAMVCSLGLPTVCIDSPASAIESPMPCDLVSMENTTGVQAVMDRLLAQGVQRIGFVGDAMHCCSFRERWIGYRLALFRAGLPVDEAACILAPDGATYGDTDWLVAQLRRMPRLPEAFLCANDFLALHLMTALKKLGLELPRDILVAGFDGLPQSAVVEPALTTVRIPGAAIGRIAADVLLRRIASPDLPYAWTRVRTEPLLRASTEREKAGR